MNNVFVCKIAKKNHEFGTFGPKIVLLQTKNELSEVKGVNEAKGAEDKCLDITGIGTRLRPGNGGLPVSGGAFALDLFNFTHALNFQY